jgi:predicted transposase YdaD
MAATPPNPHDAYFREVLSLPANARCELLAALPGPLAARVDWEHLQLQPGSFVSFDQLGPRAKEALMTTAERLIAEGEARGEAQGEARSKIEGRAEALLELLAMKFGPLPRHVTEKIQTGSSTQLKEWTARILTASRPDEVFAP